MLATVTRLFRALTLLSGAVFLLALLSFVPTILAAAGTLSSGTIAGFDFTDQALIVQRGAALGVSFILYITFNTITNLLVGYQSPTSTATTPASDGEASSTNATASQPSSEDYLSKFARMNLLFGSFFTLILVVGLGASLARSAGMISGGLFVNLLADAPKILGGIGVTVLNVALFMGVWYGLKQRATEALLIGLVCWTLSTLGGLLVMSRNLSGAGLVLAGFYGIYYAIRARGSTESTILAGRMPPVIEDLLGSSSR